MLALKKLQEKNVSDKGWYRKKGQIKDKGWYRKKTHIQHENKEDSKASPIQNPMAKVTEECFSEKRGQESFPPSNTEPWEAAKYKSGIKPNKCPLVDKRTTCTGSGVGAVLVQWSCRGS